VLVGIVDADPESFRSVEPTWWPTLPARAPGRFGLADILVPGNRTVLGRAGDGPNDLRDGQVGS